MAVDIAILPVVIHYTLCHKKRTHIIEQQFSVTHPNMICAFRITYSTCLENLIISKWIS